MNEQTMAALGLANERRRHLADLRREIGRHDLPEGCNLVATILDAPGDHEAAIPVGRLLLGIDRFGPQSLAQSLKDAGILTADKRIRDLTSRQRQALGLSLRQRASTWNSRDHRKATR